MGQNSPPFINQKIGGVHAMEINYSYNGQRTLNRAYSLQFAHNNIEIKNLCFQFNFETYNYHCFILMFQICLTFDKDAKNEIISCSSKCVFNNQSVIFVLAKMLKHFAFFLHSLYDISICMFNFVRNCTGISSVNLKCYLYVGSR